MAAVGGAPGHGVWKHVSPPPRALKQPVTPEPAVLFYATDDDGAAEEIERLIRTAGFEPEKVGGIERWGGLEVGGDLHDLVVGAAEARTLMSGT